MFLSIVQCSLLFFFFFNDTATTEIYTLSLHDALPICQLAYQRLNRLGCAVDVTEEAHLAIASRRGQRHRDLQLRGIQTDVDRKSTRLNSSHANISYAVFCLKKKKKTYTITTI